MMLKFLYALILLWPGMLWATCSPSRLAGKHPPLAYVLERAFEQEVWSADELANFLTSLEWYNPFAHTRFHLLRSQYLEAFSKLAAGLSQAEQNEIKNSLRDLRAELGLVQQISDQASEATYSVLAPKPFATLSHPDFHLSNSKPIKLSWRDGRPVFLAPTRKKSGDPCELIFDPFNADATKRAGTLNTEPSSEDEISVSFPESLLGFKVQILNFKNFTEGGTRYTAVHYIETSATELDYHGQPKKLRKSAVVNLDENRVVARPSSPDLASSQTPSRFEILELAGKRWAFYIYIDSQGQAHGVAVDPRSGQIRDDFRFGSFTIGSYASFTYDHDRYIVLADFNNITLINLTTDLRFALPDPAGFFEKRMQTFVYQGETYLLTQSLGAPARIFQLTTPTRGPR